MFRALTALVGTKAFGEQTGETGEIEQIESVVLAREHRDRSTLECTHVLPAFLESHGVVLGDRGESEFDEKAEAAHHFVFVGDLGGAIVVAHADGLR